MERHNGGSITYGRREEREREKENKKRERENEFGIWVVRKWKGREEGIKGGGRE